MTEIVQLALRASRIRNARQVTLELHHERSPLHPLSAQSCTYLSALNSPGCNVPSIITAEGELRCSLEKANIDGERYVAFLQQLLRGWTRPLIVIADRASFHHSAVVRPFVRAHRTQLR